MLTTDTQSIIRTIRGLTVILDSDLAAVYGVPTFRFNESVRRNIEKFPSDFLFQLSKEEFQGLASQSAISKTGRGGRRSLPWAFTEHGASDIFGCSASLLPACPFRAILFILSILSKNRFKLI